MIIKLIFIIKKFLTNRQVSEKTDFLTYFMRALVRKINLSRIIKHFRIKSKIPLLSDRPLLSEIPFLMTGHSFLIISYLINVKEKDLKIKTKKTVSIQIIS